MRVSDEILARLGQQWRGVFFLQEELGLSEADHDETEYLTGKNLEPRAAKVKQIDRTLFRLTFFQRKEGKRPSSLNAFLDHWDAYECLGAAFLRFDLITPDGDTTLPYLGNGLPGAVLSSTFGIQQAHTGHNHCILSKSLYSIQCLGRIFQLEGSFFSQPTGWVDCCGHAAASPAILNYKGATGKKPIHIGDRLPFSVRDLMEPVLRAYACSSGLEGIKEKDKAYFAAQQKLFTQKGYPVDSRQMRRGIHPQLIRHMFEMSTGKKTVLISSMDELPKDQEKLNHALSAYLSSRTDWVDHAIGLESPTYARKEERAMSRFMDALERHNEYIIERVYETVELGYPAILIFKGYADNHAMTVVGHTFDGSLWSSEARRYLGPGRSRLHGSRHWVDGLIVQDGNLGPYRVLSRRFLRMRPLVAILPLPAWAESFKLANALLSEKRSPSDGGTSASDKDEDKNDMFLHCAVRVAEKRLLDSRPQKKEDRSDAEAKEEPWPNSMPTNLDQMATEGGGNPIKNHKLQELREHIKTGTAVLRTVPITASDYVHSLSTIGETKDIRRALKEALLIAGQESKGENELPDVTLWMVELSVPIVFEWDQMRLGEVLVMEDVKEPLCPKFVFLRVPGAFTRRDNKEFEPCTLQEYVPLWKVDPKKYPAASLSASHKKAL